jgi:hypothetical protein
MKVKILTSSCSLGFEEMLSTNKVRRQQNLTLEAAFEKASLWERLGFSFLTLTISVFMKTLYGEGAFGAFSFFSPAAKSS